MSHTTDPVEHLRLVLTEILRVLDAVPYDLPHIAIDHGRVRIEAAHQHLHPLLEALHMAAAQPTATAISSGSDFVVIPCTAEILYDGDRWRVWAPTPITVERYRSLVADAAQRTRDRREP